jgi:hypothetical protein
METTFALLVSGDPVAIQQFSHALREFSNSPNVQPRSASVDPTIEPTKIPLFTSFSNSGSDQFPHNDLAQ